MNKTFILGFIPLVIIIAILVIGYTHHPPQNQQQLPSTITITSTTHANSTTINGTRTQQSENTITPSFRQQLGMGMLQIVLVPFNAFYYALENIMPSLPSQFYLAFMVIVAFTIPSIFANIFITHRRLLLFVVYILWFIFLVALFTYT